MNIFKRIAMGLGDILFPKNITCDFCDCELQNNQDYLCEDCYKKLPFNDKYYCIKCGAPLTNKKSKCEECMINNELYFDKGLSVFCYEGNIVDAIYDLKYKNKKYISKVLQKFIIDRYVSSNFEVDMVMAVPLNKKRERQRGYNQSDLLCNDFFDKVGLKYFKGVLVRTKNTKSQTHLNYQDRLVNIKDSFSVTNSELIKGKSILLVDDVFTTGATINECAKTLKNFGAKNIYFIALSAVFRN